MPPISRENAQQLSAPEGTLSFTLEWPAPVTAPEETVLMGEFALDGLMIRLELTPDLLLRHTRLNLLTVARTAEVDVSGLVGTRVWEIYLVWSAAGIAVHVGDVDDRGRGILSS